MNRTYYMLNSNIKHKFNAKSTIVDGIRFDSKIESRYFEKLMLLKKSGEILFFLRQVPFHLPGNIRYLVDFVEFYAPKNNHQGDVVFTDVKGYMTNMSKLKIKQVESIYGIDINIVKKV